MNMDAWEWNLIYHFKNGKTFTVDSRSVPALLYHLLYSMEAMDLFTSLEITRTKEKKDDGKRVPEAGVKDAQ